MKNNKGVTLLMLAITVIVLSILSSVSITTGSKLIKEVRISRIISCMNLVMAKVGDIYENYQFDPITNDLVGIEETSLSELSDDEKAIIAEKNEVEVDALDTWVWYTWDSETLKEQGLDSDMLGPGEYYYINYEHKEILYSVGTEHNHVIYHSYTGLSSLFEILSE